MAKSDQASSFIQSDTEAIRAAYDPDKNDDKDAGWVQSLSFTDGIETSLNQVDPPLTDKVHHGALKKLAASFSSRDSPDNPKQ